MVASPGQTLIIFLVAENIAHCFALSLQIRAPEDIPRLATGTTEMLFL
jgi:hypothetical protein